tara:strand:+ start:13524 stop:14351 length:828 start_codon:yes stop_codon:yes gene_type:complete
LLNAYSDVTTLKTRLEIPTTTTEEDKELRELLEGASRLIDKFTSRFYFVDTTTRTFDGSSAPFFLKDDLLSITTLKVDEDGDLTFEGTMAATDFILYPLNWFPKTYIRLTTSSTFGGFASGIREGVQIVGSFGYGDGKSASPTIDSGDDNDAAITTTTETTFDVASGSNFGAGQTILMDSEQMYISSISTNTLTVIRGVNGTTAATHVISTTINIYEYPEPIEEATMIQAMRWWKRRESAFADVIGTPELGTVLQFKRLDPDVRNVLTQYVKRSR